ncbi:oligosaccharide flippase family protein [Aliarcobacter butzleri]|uniref:oligosaccharide flippase family protein n=1 Tax=Aliarcobacter butzleri TaxID=28197 RepID=UPI00263DEC0E|nr:oligosaccharide flippase family protein [Aliarcobacter butzleri]MDN5076930.1 oligosaccharide flippase family protein [Aliarcobacter butzleri]MDN5118242.1 oligosaccharide flippase family protein [Aliarcobacter butzleri]
MTSLRFLFKDSVIYGGAIIINAIFMLLTIPILTKNLTVNEYGIVDLFLTLLTFLVIIFVFGQDSSVARFFYEYKSIRKKKKIISESLYFQLLVTILFLPIVYFLLRVNFEDNNNLILLIILQIPFFILINFSQNILKWTFQKSKFIIISVGSSFVILVGLILAFYFFEFTIYVVFYIYFISRIVFGLLGLFFVRKWLCKVYKFTMIKDLVKYGYPFGIISLITAGLPFAERVIVLNSLSAYELGLYSMALKLTFFISLPIQAFQTAWGPFVYSNFKNEQMYGLFNYVFKIYCIILLLLLLLLDFMKKYIISILSSQDYLEASSIVFFLALSIVILAIGNILELGIDFSKKSYLKLYGFIFSFIISLSSSYFLINNYGFNYAGVGLVIGSICKVIIDSFLAYKVHIIRWRLKQIFIIFFIIISFKFFIIGT